MYTEYKLNNEKKLLLAIWEFFRDEFRKKYTNYLDGYEVDNEGKIRKIRAYIFKDNKGYYFVYNGTQKYINDYVYLTLDELIEKIENEEISIEEFVSTLLKESKKAIIVEKLPVLENEKIDLENPNYMPKMKKIGCKIITEELKDYAWENKISTTPVNKENQKTYGIQEYHIIELYSLIKNGYFRLEKKKTISRQKTLKK